MISLSNMGVSKEATRAAEVLVNTATQAAQVSLQTSLNANYPVGSVHIRADLINPATALGVGTWALTSKQRAIAGYDSTAVGFNAAEKTGGAATVTLTANEMPSHTHTQNAHSHNTIGDSTGADVVVGVDSGTGSRDGSYAGIIGATIATNQNTGGGAAHENTSPYMVFAIWKRIS